MKLNNCDIESIQIHLQSQVTEYEEDEVNCMVVSDPLNKNENQMSPSSAPAIYTSLHARVRVQHVLWQHITATKQQRRLGGI